MTVGVAKAIEEDASTVVAASSGNAAATAHRYDPRTQCLSVVGGLNGILNVLLAAVEPGQEVVNGRSWLAPGQSISAAGG